MQRLKTLLRQKVEVFYRDAYGNSILSAWHDHSPENLGNFNGIHYGLSLGASIGQMGFEQRYSPRGVFLNHQAKSRISTRTHKSPTEPLLDVFKSYL